VTSEALLSPVLLHPAVFRWNYRASPCHTGKHRVTRH